MTPKPPNNLSRLAELTEKLVPFPPPLHTASGYTEYTLSRGTALCWALKQTDYVSVSKWYLSAGAYFPAHVHEQREWIIVYRGELRVNLPGETVVVGVGQSIDIPPGTAHDVDVPMDCWCIAITVPGNVDYPHVEKSTYP
jgi:quercetin dioxygenase-like cupin family protein